MVRGPESSRPIDDVVSEVSRLASKGVSEITLLGQNVNSYGRDATRRRPLFAQLLREVGAVDGIRRVRFTSPHPKDLLPETIDAMATVDAVCEQLHFPLQSGSDRILAMMHRGYNAERYLAKLSAAREMLPDLAVTTDIIVGFPGETEDDFEQTLKVAAVARFDAAYTFEFSSRPGTVAARMADQFVDSSVISSRFSRLVDLVERSALERNRARVGLTEEVQVEGISKKDTSVLTGRTRQGKLVHFRSEQPLHPGSYVQVRITDAGPHHLKGEYRDKMLLKSNHRRIPVRAAC
jgi:tRNA-2-methylthio-N6-dimethylallyladenosine synthase